MVRAMSDFGREKGMFIHDEEQDEMTRVLDTWSTDPKGMKPLFLKLKEKLLRKEETSIRFISRPGVSYSLRASIDEGGKKGRTLFALVDIIDDEPENRWLSVCFFEETITDPDERGNLVPGGILGEDGYCFDLYENDAVMVLYIEGRIDEAFEHLLSFGGPY